MKLKAAPKHWTVLQKALCKLGQDCPFDGFTEEERHELEIYYDSAAWQRIQDRWQKRKTT